MPRKSAKATAAEIIAGTDFDWSDLGASLEDELAAIAREAGRAMFAATGKDDMFDVADESGIAYGKARGAELVGMRILRDGRVVRNPNPEWAITRSTREALRGLTVTALEEGWSAAKFRDAIIGSESFSNARALMIARTEAAIAHNSGQLAAAIDSGVVEYKQWQVSDSEVCDDCEENDEEIVAVGDTFSSGDDRPPLHPNCRCTLVYMSAEEAAAEGGSEDDEV